MALRTAPALLPALLAFGLFRFATTSERALPAPATVAVGGLGLALGGGAGAALIAGAGGVLAGLSAREDAPLNAPSLVAEAEGRICGRWRRRAEFSAWSARFCPGWARQGSLWLAHPPRFRLSVPDGSAPPPVGSAVRARGSLTRFPGFSNQPERPPGPWRLRVKSFQFLTVGAGPGAAGRLSNALRATIDRRLRAARGRSHDGVPLARALILGDDDELPEELRRALRRCGLAHLLAVSGFNLTLVASLAALAAGARGRRRALALPALVVSLYLAAVGQEPSLLRAAFMAGAALALHGVGRAGAPLQALAVAAVALAAFEPTLALDPGLQLSCGATGGLLLWSRRWAESLGRLPRPLAGALGASIAAQIGALPASVAAFGELAPLAPLVNLVALPWAAAATVAALLWMMVALVSSPLAAACAPALDLLVVPLAALDRLPPSLWVSTPIEGGAVAGWALAAAGAFAMEALRAGRLAPVSFAMALLLQTPGRQARPEVEVVFADVGQGDAAIVRAGETVVLVDGGGLVGRDVGTDVLRSLLVGRGWLAIDAAIVSHPHRDHCAGLLELSHHLRIEELLVAPGALGDSCVAELAARTRRGARPLVAGLLWSRGGLVIEALHPGAAELGAGVNAGSLVVRARAAGRALLFPGDIGAEEELRLMRSAPASLASDVLKVAHHGSAGSSTVPFLDAVAPRLAVVSAGASNPFGHPSPAALGRLHAVGATVLRTDRDGEVSLSWNRGEPIRIALPSTPRVEQPRP